MKITAFILLAFCIHVSASTLAQTVTLSEHRASLEKVINDIKQQTGYSFFYNEDWLQQAQPVELSVKNSSLEDALKACFKNQPFDYAIVNKTIVLKLKEKITVSPNVPSPEVIVTGKVTNELGAPMPGVTVKQKDNPQNGEITDKNANFNIAVPNENTVIVFSYIGYETQELRAKDIPTGGVIVLKVAENNLKEVVINKGYYDEKQELSTGSVSVVTAKTIQEQPVSDPIQALVGRVAGLNIQQTSGLPGSYATILIRGQNSIANGNDPLYVIDGVPFSSQSLTNTAIGGGAVGAPSVLNVSNFTGGQNSGQGMSPFNSLDPADIESIEILKDADATAIYGSRGANGVILITTKKGKAGDTKFDFNAQQGYSSVGHFMDLLNTQQYLAMRHQAFANDGLAVPSIAANPNDRNYDVNGFWDTTRYTNWQKTLIGGTAQFTNIQGTLSGGNANTQFLIGGGYTHQTTVFPGDYGDTKGSVHVTLSHSSSDQKFHAQFSASYINDNSDIPGIDLTNQIGLAPDAPALYNKDGSLNWQLNQGSFTFNNPLQYTFASYEAVTQNLVSNLNLSYNLAPGLQLKSNFGFNHEQMNQTQLMPSIAQAPPNNTNPDLRSNDYSTTDFQTWIIEPQLSYEKKIGRGQFSALLGTTIQQTIQKSISEYSYGFSNDELISDAGAASSYQFGNDSYTQYRYNAVYARIGYNWEEKYLINLTARRDGSSRFGPGKQFGNFGAAGAGWIFSKESLIQNGLPWLSFGKLRASYGITGNDQITDYQFLSTYSPNYQSYQGVSGLSPSNLTNPNFRWEEVKKLEAAIDLGFLKDRINLSVDYYRNRTVNQLVGYPLPSLSGFTTVQFNLPATVQNSGLEIALNTTNVKTKNFNWSTSINFTLPSNKLVSFPSIENFGFYSNQYVVGESLFIKKVYDYTGVDPQTGLYTFKTSGNSDLPQSPQDQIFSQPITQKYYGGLSNTFSYKGFHLDIFFQFVKQTGYSFSNYFVPPGIRSNTPNEPTAILSAWNQPGDLTNIQRFSTGNPAYNLYAGYYRLSNGIFTDASFVRLKNVSFSYNLPSEWQNWAHLRNGRIFLQGQNLLTFTKYVGLDPETQGLSLPPLRTITVGLSGTF